MRAGRPAPGPAVAGRQYSPRGPSPGTPSAWTPEETGGDGAMTTALPELCRGLAIVPGADGLLIEGGPRRHWLPGQAAALLPGLLDLLDGRHDRPAITGALGLTDRQLGRVLSVLG